MSFWLLFATHMTILVLCFYTYIWRKFSFWSRLGILGPPPSLLRVGTLTTMLGEPSPVVEARLQRTYGLVYGMYEGLRPVLTVSDRELAHRILVRDFPQWTNRRELNTFHPLVNNGQFWAGGWRWKRLRTITGKSFTSGKLRAMTPLMRQCIHKLDRYLTKVSQDQSKNTTIETKAVVTNFTFDVIASTSFGIDPATTADFSTQNSSKPTNDFVTNATRLLTSGQFRIVSWLGAPSWLNRLMKVEHNFDAQSSEFFFALASNVLKQRKQQMIDYDKYRSQPFSTDLLHLLMTSTAMDAELNDADYNKLTATAAGSNDTDNNNDEQTKTNGAKVGFSKLTDLEITAQNFLFLFAGFETTSSTITNILFELARHLDVQDRLSEQITSALAGLDPESQEYFDKVMGGGGGGGIPYLDATIKETLRKYPPVFRVERRLMAEEYRLKTGLVLKKGQLVEISTVGVHYNPDYYPEPERFLPERFMPENKGKLLPYTYLPFGDGPRNCVGMRFAYQEVKLLMAHLLPRFRFTPTSQTPTEPKISIFKSVLTLEPFPLSVQQRRN